MSIAEIPVARCPFCGSSDCSPTRHMRFVWTECDSCGARGPKIPQSSWYSIMSDEYFIDLNAAVTIWNKRA